MFELFARLVHPFLANNPKTMNDLREGRLTEVSEYHVVIVIVYALGVTNNSDRERNKGNRHNTAIDDSKDRATLTEFLFFVSM